MLMDSFSEASVNLSNFLGSVQSEATLCLNTIRLASYSLEINTGGWECRRNIDYFL